MHSKVIRPLIKQGLQVSLLRVIWSARIVRCPLISDLDQIPQSSSMSCSRKESKEATRAPGLTTRSKEATRAPGLTTRSKEATRAPGLTTRSKDPTRAPGLTTGSNNATRGSRTHEGRVVPLPTEGWHVLQAHPNALKSKELSKSFSSIPQVVPCT